MINKDDLKKYYARTRQLILNPKREWSLIDNEHDSPLQLFSNYLIPLAIMASIVVLLLGFLHYNGLHTLLYTLINFISITLGTYLTFIITREYLTGKLPDAEGTALHLSVYSAAVFTLFHSLSVALVSGFWSQLLGLISLIFLRTLHAGISGITKLETSQKTSMLIIMALSIICIPVICKRLLMILFHIPVFNL